MDNNDRVLLVEGTDDEHVVRHLRLRHRAMPQFSIQNKEGIEKLLDDIGLEILAPGRKAIGIIVDANDDLDARWDAVTDRLRDENIEVPNSPDPTGTIISSTPRVGLWLMPDNTSPGELENFVSEMIPDDDPIWPRSQHYIDDIPETDRKFTEKKILRAKVHAWLATREDPRPMGTAIRARDLHIDGTLSTTFAKWLRQLFE
ncbi:MAG: hypothetical protein OXI94_12820 [Gemmatimonadota bacterium]|nr:hypothetical protein [Gemmatimonadota bacterium]